MGYITILQPAGGSPPNHLTLIIIFNLALFQRVRPCFTIFYMASENFILELYLCPEMNHNTAEFVISETYP